MPLPAACRHYAVSRQLSILILDTDLFTGQLACSHTCHYWDYCMGGIRISHFVLLSAAITSLIFTLHTASFLILIHHYFHLFNIYSLCYRFRLHWLIISLIIFISLLASFSSADYFDLFTPLIFIGHFRHSRSPIIILATPLSRHFHFFASAAMIRFHYALFSSLIFSPPALFARAVISPFRYSSFRACYVRFISWYFAAFGISRFRLIPSFHYCATRLRYWAEALRLLPIDRQPLRFIRHCQPPRRHFDRLLPPAAIDDIDFRADFYWHCFIWHYSHLMPHWHTPFYFQIDTPLRSFHYCQLLLSIAFDDCW